MKIFLAGAFSSASQKQLNKYEVYRSTILASLPNAVLTTPDDILDFRNQCIKANPEFSKLQIDKMMVDFDLKSVRESEVVVCDISEQSSGMGLELGVCKERDINVIFCFEKGAYVSNMIYGAFSTSSFIEYDSPDNLTKQLHQALKAFK